MFIWMDIFCNAIFVDLNIYSDRHFILDTFNIYYFTKKEDNLKSLYMSNICFILNYAPHYRFNLFKKIDEELKADFYFGRIKNLNIKKIDFTEISNFKAELRVVNIFKRFKWIQGSVKLLFKPYAHYVLSGDPHLLSNWLILLLASILKKKIYLWTHGWYGNETWLKKQMKILYYKRAAKLLVYGKYAKELMIQEGFDESKIIVVYNSIDDEFLFDLRSKMKKNGIYKKKFNNEASVLLYIGRIQKLKRLDLILKGIVILNRRLQKVNLIVIGEECLDYDIQSEIIDLNLQGQVWLYGPCYNEEEISNLIFNADICVSPGNIGLTAIHSLAFGTPIITHNNFKHQMPEFEAIHEHKTGLFFKEGSVEDLASKISELLLLLKTKELEITNECYKIVDTKYNSNNQLQIFKSVFDNL